MKKYEFTGKTKEYNGRTLRQIRALKDFGDVFKGDIGGWIENEGNLSHEGLCWVGEEAMVYEKARIAGNAVINYYAKVFDNAVVGENCRISGNAQIGGCVILLGDTTVSGNAVLSGSFVCNKIFL